MLKTDELTILPITPEQTYPLRHAVLWPDKPVEYVKVENDADGHHFGAFLNSNLVAVISLFVDEQTGSLDRPELANPSRGQSRQARFRKFAAHPDYQRMGIGTRLMEHIIIEARRLGATELWCDARLDAADFYRRFSMEAVSDVFYKGPIAYARFACSL